MRSTGIVLIERARYQLWVQGVIVAFWAKSKHRRGFVGVVSNVSGVCLAEVVRVPGARPVVRAFEYRAWDSAQDEQAVLAALARDHRLARRRVTTMLAPGEYSLLPTEAPDVPTDELRAAVRWRIKDLIDFHIDDAVIDVFALPGEAVPGRARSMMAVATRHETVRRYIDMLENASMALEVVDIPEMAQRNLARLLDADTQGVVVISFGEHSGLLTVTRQGELYMSRNLDIGLAQMDASSDFAPPYERIALEVQRSLDYYDSHFRQAPISEIVLLPMAHEPAGLVEGLRNALGLEVRIMDLGAAFEWEVDVTAAMRASGALVLGAALKQEARV